MSTGKPSLISKEYKDHRRQEKKIAGEESFKVDLPLPKTPPVQLDGMPEGQKAWRSLMRAHGKLPADLLSVLDREFLLNYCTTVQLHRDAVDLVTEISQKYNQGAAVLEDLLKARVELRMTLRLLLDYSKQLFGNPRSRGGTTPPTKEIADEMDREMDWAKHILEDGDDHEHTGNS
jgi:hypothetical protein